ncbi:MAG: sugar phosphate nucleotidyltransferase [Nitrospinota bacterium]
MNVMILAAGLATRLRPHSNYLPKPLFPIIDRTLIEYSIDLALMANPDVIVINSHVLASQLIEFIKLKNYGVKIEVVVEPTILGTAGGVYNAKEWLENDDFLIINSDMLYQPDLESLLNFHSQKRAITTLSLLNYPANGDYNPLYINRDGVVTKLGKISTSIYDKISSKGLFSGVSVNSPAIFELIATGFDLTETLFSKLLLENQLFGKIDTAPWADLGQLDLYYNAVMSQLADSDLTPATFWADAKQIRINPPLYIEPGSNIASGSIIGPNAVIHRDSKIEANANVSDSILLPGSHIEKGEIVHGSLISPAGRTKIKYR